MKHYDITKPIGLATPCKEIGHTCSKAQIYKQCDLRPNHYIIPLDPGSGRTTLVEYMTDKYKEAGVLSFNSGLDDYIEIAFDGSLQQLKQAFAAIDSAAVYTNSYSDIAYSLSESYNDIPDYENSLSANIATVAKIDPDGGWGSLPLEEKIEVLETIIRIECRYLGMQDSAPALELAYLEEGLLGRYDSEKDVVTLSYNYVVDSEAGGYSVIQVLCHEIYHRYQHYQVNLLQAIRYNDDTAKYANLLVLDTAGIYEDEFGSYISPDDDSAISYYLYSSQRLERDAEKYSNASVVGYYEQICSYLESN